MIPIPIGQAEWFPFALSLICCLPIIIWFVVWILIGVWVYRDAESRGMSGVLWLIVVFLIGIIGLIIYLIVRKEKKSAPPPIPP